MRINSGGGDVFAAQAIGAQIDSLNKAGTETVCRIDGLCASAATIIASHCSKVVANGDALYMIHLPSVCLWDACDENDLQAYLNELKAVKDSILQLYAKKDRAGHGCADRLDGGHKLVYRQRSQGERLY